jgi:hypothetical protein
MELDPFLVSLIRSRDSYWPEGAQPHHHLFVRFVDPKMSARTHNLHLVEAGGQYWKERLLLVLRISEGQREGTKRTPR